MIWCLKTKCLGHSVRETAIHSVGEWGYYLHVRVPGHTVGHAKDCVALKRTTSRPNNSNSTWRQLCHRRLDIYTYFTVHIWVLLGDMYVEPGELNRYRDGLWAGRPGFGFRHGKETFLFSMGSGPTLRSNQPPIQWVPRAVSPGVKPLGCEVYYSPPSSAKVKNGGAMPPLSHTSSWRGA
jgi:hypothetical protein